MQDLGNVTAPAYEQDGTYPGTCIRLQPLKLWWASLILLFFGWPSYGLLSSMIHEMLKDGQNPAVRVFLLVPLLAYIAWHSAMLLVAAYLWIGRLEFRVNVEQRKVEIYRGVGRFGWTWAWDFKDVLGLERMGLPVTELEGVDPAKLKGVAWSGLSLKTKGKGMLWGFSLKGEDAEKLLALLKHRHPMFHPAEKDPLHS